MSLERNLMKKKASASRKSSSAPKEWPEIDEDPKFSHIGFKSREDADRDSERSSKIGTSAASTANVLASSSAISTAPDSMATGEDTSDTPTRSPESTDETIPPPPEPEERFDYSIESDEYSSESDELELGRAVLEEATQSPGDEHDPSAAPYQIEETDDDASP